MSILDKALKAAAGNAGVDAAPNVADVFSTYVYAGTGSSQTINNGINFLGAPLGTANTFSTTLYTGIGAGNSNTIYTGINLAADGGLVWIKGRDYGTGSNCLFDTDRGVRNVLHTDNANSENLQGFGGLDSFISSGFVVKSTNDINENNRSLVSWTFKKAPRFFDVVTYTGTGISGREIAHDLGVAPGMIIVKNLSGTYDWSVYHRSTGETQYLILNTTAAVATDGSERWNNTAPTDSVFTLGNNGRVNGIGDLYVAYLFAHDQLGASGDGSDGTIACGSFNSTGFVDLGWEPQYVLMKSTTDTSSYMGDWRIFDSERGVQVGDDAQLFANESRPEDTSAFASALVFNSTGFTVESQGHYGTSTVYMAIRKPQYGDDPSGGMVWIKGRHDSTMNHWISDTERTSTDLLATNLSAAEDSVGSSVTGFNAHGFSLGAAYQVNEYSGNSYVSWGFKKAPRFFDVVTYTGNGVTGREIAHDLGVDIGMIFIKSTSNSYSWQVYHKDVGDGYGFQKHAHFDTGAFYQAYSYHKAADQTSTYFKLGLDNAINSSGVEYVAYLFAHDPDDDGMIACGSYTGTGSLLDVDLGWEPQYLLVKAATSGGNDMNWYIWDTMRGFPGGADVIDGHPLYANTIGSEINNDDHGVTATGFQVGSGNAVNYPSATYIYMAIRAPMMKEPEAATEVFAIEYGTSSVPSWISNFPVDMALNCTSHSATTYKPIASRLTGTSIMYTNLDWAQGVEGNNTWDFMNGWNKDSRSSAYQSWMWKRAKGYFDVCAYTGNGTAGRTVNHSLGVVPEMMWVKERGNAGNWNVYTEFTGKDETLQLNTSSGNFSQDYWNNTLPTDNIFTVGSNTQQNGSGRTYIAYLFATLDGVSKVGSYTGNGGSQNIACGFSGGARFVLIKRTDSTGDWYIWDSTRGIVAGNDPYLSLNTTSAEVTTDDSIDPVSDGFTVNQVSATNINVSSALYIFLAIA